MKHIKRALALLLSVLLGMTLLLPAAAEVDFPVTFTAKDTQFYVQADAKNAKERQFTVEFELNQTDEFYIEAVSDSGAFSVIEQTGNTVVVQCGEKMIGTPATSYSFILRARHAGSEFTCGSNTITVTAFTGLGKSILGAVAAPFLLMGALGVFLLSAAVIGIPFIPWATQALQALPGSWSAPWKALYYTILS